MCPAIIRITSEPFNRRDNTFRGWLTEKSCDSTFVSIGPFFFFFSFFLNEDDGTRRRLSTSLVLEGMT